jgi:hypothetical protein
LIDLTKLDESGLSLVSFDFRNSFFLSSKNAAINPKPKMLLGSEYRNEQQGKEFK